MKYYLFLITLFVLFFIHCSREVDEPEDQELYPVPSSTLSIQTINAVLVDSYNEIWIGTDEGLYKYDRKIWLKHNAFEDFKVSSLTLHSDRILMATDSGAYIIQADNTNHPLIEKQSPLETLPFGAISIFDNGMGDRKWIGLADGVAMFDGTAWLKNKAITRNLVSISNVRGIAFRANDCFLATHGRFLYRIIFNPETDAITGASQLLGGAENPILNYNGELTTDTIFCVHAGTDSSIWFGSPKGLTRNKESTKVDKGIFEYFLRSERVHCVYEFHDGSIWAGTENGIFVKSGSMWTNYDVSDGLPGSFVRCISEESDGSVWIGTNRGISHFKEGMFINF